MFTLLLTTRPAFELVGALQKVRRRLGIYRIRDLRRICRWREVKNDGTWHNLENRGSMWSFLLTNGNEFSIQGGILTFRVLATDGDFKEM
jgi:hypothetical protein